jgi:uncharacterized protein (UPF0261 family)
MQRSFAVIYRAQPAHYDARVIPHSAPCVLLLATLDTKGPEATFVAERLRALRMAVHVVDTSCGGAGGDRGIAVARAAEAAVRTVRQAYAQGELAGVLALGGSAGTTIGTAAMRALPIGVPKLMVSTLASGQVRPYVRDKDIVMINPIVDIAGINRVSRQILSNAAAAMAGMIAHPPAASTNDKPLIAATMFGVTTPCVSRAKEVLEAAGYEVLVFHATGSGGQAMESLIREGLFAGVLDVTTTELADELVGGTLSAGPTRLTAAGEMGVPQVVSVGALDMVNFGPRETVPAKFADRQFHVHNSNVTLMRTTAEENAKLGQLIGRKLSSARGPVAVMLPLGGVSALDKAGGPFDNPAARSALYDALQRSLTNCEVIKLPHHVNDAPFAETAAARLIELIQTAKKESHGPVSA